MIPSTFTLTFVVATSALSAHALPIFSGLFGPSSSSPVQVQRRDDPSTTNVTSTNSTLTDGQLAQGTNAFFQSLLLEDICTPGQVGCINNNTATCSPEGNWEITPCTGNSTCLALPASSTNTTTQDLVVTCTNPTFALSLIEAAGGSDALAVDYSITTAPFNTTDFIPAPTDSNSTTTTTDLPTSTDPTTDVPTATDSDSTVPSATCTPDDGSDGGDDGSDDGSDDGNDGGDDGSYDGSDDGPNDGSDDGNDGSDDGSDPTGTDASNPDPTATCTDDPSAEPTETEFITVIAFPDPTNSSEYSYSTLEPTETIPDDATPTEIDFPTATDSSTDTGYPCTETQTGTDSDATFSADITSTDTDTTTTTDSSYTGTPTALTITPNFSISTPVPDVSALGTFAVPISSVSMPVYLRRRGGMMKKVKRSS